MMKYLFAAIDARQARLSGRPGSGRSRNQANELKKVLADASEGVDEKTSTHDFVDTLERIVNEIKNTTEHSTAFLQRVKKTEAPDYYDVIKRPMDLATLHKRVKSQMYRSKKAFADDLDLIWSNCLLYNSHPSHALRRSAEFLRQKSNQLLEFITDPALPTRSIFSSSVNQRGKGDTPMDDGDEDGDAEGESDDEDVGGRAGSQALGGRLSGVNQKLLSHVNGDDILARDRTASPTPSQGGTPMPGERTPHRKIRGLHGRRSRSGSAAPEQLFEDSPAIIRTAQGMQDFALLDDELARLEATLGWAPVASTSSLGLLHPPPPPPPPAIPVLPNPPLPNPSPLSTTISSTPLTAANAGTPKDPASPAPTPILSAEQARLGALVKALNPSTSVPVAVPKRENPPDSLWWETVAVASTSAVGMPRCSFANHVEGDSSIASPVLGKSGKGKGKGKAARERIRIKDAENGRASAKAKAKAKAKGAKAKGKAKANGAHTPTKGLGIRMRRNFETLKQIRRVHNMLADGARPADDPLDVLPLASDSETDDDEPPVSSFLETGIPPEAFRTHAAPQAARDSLGVVSNRILSHAGFDGASATAVGVLAHVASEYLMNLGLTMRFYADRYGSQMSTEQMLLHVLAENGVPAPSHLESYVAEDVDRYGVKLDDLLGKLQRAREDQLDALESGPPANEDQLLAEDSELFLLGEFGGQTGQDFFGLAELGLDKELGLATLTIPPKLFRGDSGRPSDLGETGSAEADLKYPPPPPHIPLTPSAIECQIGLLRPVFSLRQQTDAGLVDDALQPVRPKAVRNKIPPSGRLPVKGLKRKGDDPVPTKGKKKKVVVEKGRDSE